MPGDYGPAGKWIHDRAHRIMREGDTKDEYGKKKGKSIAYAIATQQAHKLGKSPKDFRTPSGVRKAKQKYDEPRAEYQKTAMAAFFDELGKIAQGLGDGSLENRMALGGTSPSAQASIQNLVSGGGGGSSPVASGLSGGVGSGLEDLEGGGIGGGGLDTKTSPMRSGPLSTGATAGGGAAQIGSAAQTPTAQSLGIPGARPF